MKKLLAITLAVISCVCLFCACGNGDKSSVDEALIARFGGDWNGCVEFEGGTGKYETLTGTVAAIARFNVDKKGNVTPFIGLDVEDTPFEDLTARFDGDGVLLSGKWISAEFKDIPMTEKNGTLSTSIPIEKEAGSVTLAFNFRRLDDTGWTDEDPGFSESQINACMGKSFDELAEIIGYSKSDYPESVAAPAKEDKPADGGSKAADSIVGSWEYVNGGYIYTFNADGTGSYSAGSTVMNFTYEDDGKAVKILYTGNTTPNEFTYTISGNTLSIEDSFGDKVEYKKK